MFPRLFGEISLPRRSAVLPIARVVSRSARPRSRRVRGADHGRRPRRAPRHEGFGARLRAERLDAIDAVVGPYWRDCGLEPRPGCGSYDHLYLDIYPPSLDPGFSYEIDACQPLRPVTIDEPGGDELSEWLARDDDRPLVYLTFGTIFNVTEARSAPVEALRARCALITVGPRGDSAFGALPERIAVAHYVPQHHPRTPTWSSPTPAPERSSPRSGRHPAALPAASGRPVQQRDCGRNVGAAIQLAPQDADPERVRTAIELLLSDDAYVEHARRVAADIAAMPSPDEVAAIITARF
jgi:hypothetical protein